MYIQFKSHFLTKFKTGLKQISVFLEIDIFFIKCYPEFLNYEKKIIFEI